MNESNIGPSTYGNLSLVLKNFSLQPLSLLIHQTQGKKDTL